MNFESLDDIIAHFGLDATSSEEVKKELKKLIKELHPDKNGGEYKSIKDKDTHHEIQEAFEFIAAINNSLATKKEITALTKVLKDLAITKKEESASEQIEKKRTSLSSKIQESVIHYHKQNNTPKISGLVIASLITALWAFPNVVKDHPILSFLLEYNLEFTIVWLSSLSFAGALWLKIQSAEKQDEQIKKSYKLESTQNGIFRIFIEWAAINPRNFDYVDKKKIVQFTKEELITFLITRYDIFQRKLSGLEYLRDHELRREIEQLEEIYFKNQRHNYGSKGIFSFTRFIKRPGTIDLELAQVLADLIVERLTSKEVLSIKKTKSISDKYEFQDE